MFHVRFVSLGKTLTDFQILGRELHQNVFGVRDLPVAYMLGSYSALLDPSRYEGEGG